MPQTCDRLDRFTLVSRALPGTPAVLGTAISAICGQPGNAIFTGPLTRPLALVAIVLGGLMFMFSEDGAKRQISGIVFGGGLARFAADFLTSLF